ncbi:MULTISPECIES: hypothetical protein [unclassified Streptomyces]|uniref:hypothetical protein n=1 Tax=unclassified Streptomyces TaxID=2593676 RepID=UPI0003726A50|nr:MULTISPECIES: hypothetical protein [unclassified Streptomyces]MYT30992.1 hypothetical protein [Streptomyces sp. SID8354]
MRPAIATARALRAAGAALLVVLLSAVVAGCGGPDPLLRDEGPAVAPTARTGPVYAAGDAGRPLQRPSSLPLGGSARLTGLRWESWGGATAVAGGGLVGDWCAPACVRRPYQVKVTLSGLQRQEGFAYYSSAGVVAPEVHGAKAAELGRVSLHLPDVE